MRTILGRSDLAPSTKRPRVSVIVPAFNAASSIRETLDSILGQTCDDFDVTVVDDGSTDDTASIARAMGDRRVRAFTFRRGGLSAARNRGLALATGRYVTFLDADDLWSADKLAAQLEALIRDPTAAIAYSWTMLIDEQGRYLFAKVPSRYSGNVHRALLSDLFLGSGSNVMIDRERTRCELRFDESLNVAEDWDLYLKLARNHDFVCVPRYQIHYRLVRGSLSSRFLEMEAVMRATAARELAACESDDVVLARRIEAMIHEFVALQILTRGALPIDHKASATRWGKAMLADPRAFFRLRSWLLPGLLAVLAVLPADRRASAMTATLRLYGQILRIVRADLRAATTRPQP